MKYSGSVWIMAAIKPEKMSDLGTAVADLLGNLFLGIYHLDLNKLHDVDWGNERHIEFALGWKSMSTFDNSLLTHLVLLAHRSVIRVEITPRANNYLTLSFQKREHGIHVPWHKRHPTMQESLNSFNLAFPDGDEL